MSWIRGSSLSWSHLLFVKLLKCGQIPKHVAFIMDGNRRYAKKTKVEKLDGHVKGFDKLSETLQWCLDLGILEVTVYAFSIENFKRTKEEVDGLMDLARQKFKNLLNEKDKLMEQGVRIRILGNKSYLPEDLVRLIAEVELMTMDNSRAILNVAFSYTAQDEVTTSLNAVLGGLAVGELSEEDLSVPLLVETLHTRDSSLPEIIVRTSGETRLSDFLLLQGSCSLLYFSKALWPELTAWELLWAVFLFQRAAPRLEACLASLGLSQPLSPKGLAFSSALSTNHAVAMAQFLQVPQEAKFHL